MPIRDDDSYSSEHREIATVSTDDSSKARDVEFADLVEKLNFAIVDVKKLKPWKDRALKAESLNRKLTLTLSKLKDELTDTQYELQKWKKRAVRAEQENQAEILKWKSKVKNARESRTELLDNEEDELLNDDGETFTNLVSERDEAEDNSTISTFKEERGRKDLKNKSPTGNSFRDKWKNIKFDEPVTNDDHSLKEDGTSTLIANDIVLQYEVGVFGKEQEPEDGSAVEAEEILNNYLSMKGRFNSRRFDSSGKTTAKTGKRLEV